MSQSLLKQVCSDNTLQAAASWVQAKNSTYRPNLSEIGNLLNSGDYCFQPLRTVKTTHKLGEPETLEIWEPQDQLVLKAISLVVTKHFSDVFPASCHHLEGRGGIKKAVRQTRDFVQKHPDSWVMKTDVKGYYANIDHFVLYKQLNALMPNEPTLMRFMWQHLQRTVEDGGNYYNRERGISLGCSLSPFLAALYLLPLDKAFEGQDYFYARFMDDWVIITPTRWKLRSAVKRVNIILNQQKLTKASNKTFIGRSQRGFDFLSYHFTPQSLTLQRRDARIYRLYEQGADDNRVGESVSRWQRWAKAGLQERLTETDVFNSFPRQGDACKLPFDAKFLALGVASVLSTAAFDSHATIYLIDPAPEPNFSPMGTLHDLDCDGTPDIMVVGELSRAYGVPLNGMGSFQALLALNHYWMRLGQGGLEWVGDNEVHVIRVQGNTDADFFNAWVEVNLQPGFPTTGILRYAYESTGGEIAPGDTTDAITGSCLDGVFTPNTVPQTITFDSPPTSKIYGDPTFDLSATGGDSGNPVTIGSSTSTVCSVDSPDRWNVYGDCGSSRG